MIIHVLRKPLVGTVAANVLTHGCGALNIDDCRVAGPAWKWETQTDIRGGGYATKRPSGGHVLARNVEGNPTGRWPANLVHDGSAEVLGVFPEEAGSFSLATGPDTPGVATGFRPSAARRTYDKTRGSASRFFQPVTIE